MQQKYAARMPPTEMSTPRQPRVLNAPKPRGRGGIPTTQVKSDSVVSGVVYGSNADTIMRPYAFACHQLYAKLVRSADGAFHNIGENTSTLVNGIHLDDFISCRNADGTESTVTVADALYGFRVKGGHFTNRRATHASYHITNPFEAAQIYAMSKGYYLANTSDPTKGLKLRIEVSKTKSNAKPLWHGQNIQPTGVKFGESLQEEGFEDITCFYMKPIREAAIYVNSTFDKTCHRPVDSTEPTHANEQVLVTALVDSIDESVEYDFNEDEFNEDEFNEDEFIDDYAVGNDAVGNDAVGNDAVGESATVKK
jgi:hypothetical protein